ncbi:MAG: hypothetical protein EKK62_11900 [Acidimicrobiia bacterium]|nr:MAG: hypothetical protein EKK62_11900 [Acidimicrobiia bacterium]
MIAPAHARYLDALGRAATGTTRQRTDPTNRRPRMAYSVPLHRLRWKGYRRWHRFHIGPLSLAFYVYPPDEHLGWRGTRLHVATHSWRYVDAEGVGRHTLTFRRWARRT